jgi:hypothetical protein
LNQLDTNTFTADITIPDKIIHAGDTNTAIRFPAADTVTVETSGTERMRIDASGNLGLGVTPRAWNSAGRAIELGRVGSSIFSFQGSGSGAILTSNAFYNGGGWKYANTDVATTYETGEGKHRWFVAPSGTAGNAITFTQAMTLDASGNLLVGTTSVSPGTDNVSGIALGAAGYISITRDGNASGQFNRKTDDGTIILLAQDSTTEGSISVSGTTVSYNGGHLSRWAQFPDNSRPELLKGTVMSNLDQMSNWNGEDNEQLNCVQVSTVEGDANVAGVFVAWDTTEDDYNDILLGMTGDMVIRIAGGTTVQRGDLLMSAGDGTAKPQGDDIVRSKTIAKVTSTHVSHTYADGSYAVPCVLMAC